MASAFPIWIKGQGWLSEVLKPDPDTCDPDGCPPDIPGTQQAQIAGVWYYVLPPQNLAVMLQAAAQHGPATSQADAPGQAKPDANGMSINPMAMMQMVPHMLMLQMLKASGMIPDNEPKSAPLNLPQMKELASVIGDKVRDTVITGIQIWKGVKG